VKFTKTAPSFFFIDPEFDRHLRLTMSTLGGGGIVI